MSKWVITAKRADFAEIAQKYGIDPVIARVIRNRDIVGEEEIQEFLYGTPEDIPSPYLLKDVQKAAEILKDKIAEGKKIRVIGDYDIDGVYSTYILVRGLRECGADVDEVIPHRILDGYGLNDSLIQQAGEDGVDTIVTCDNGIAADAQIRLAKELGMTVKTINRTIGKLKEDRLIDTRKGKVVMTLEQYQLAQKKITDYLS